MSCLSHFTKQLTSVEMDEGYCTKLRSRGISVVCDNVERIRASAFPMADVYYWWPSDTGGQNELWLLLIARHLRQRERSAKVCTANPNPKPKPKPKPSLSLTLTLTLTLALTLTLSRCASARTRTGRLTCSTCRGWPSGTMAR